MWQKGRAFKNYNCIDFLSITGKYYLPDFYSKLSVYICRNFETIPEEKRISSLKADDLESMLSQNYLMVSSEYKLFGFVINWMNKDIERRRNYLTKLLKKIRLPLLTSDELDKVKKQILVYAKNDEINSLVKKAMEYQMLEEKQPLMQDESTQVRSDILSIVILHKRNLLCFNTDTNRQSEIKYDTIDLELTDLVTYTCELSNYMYLYYHDYNYDDDDDGLTSKFYRFDPRHARWYSLPSMAFRELLVLKGYNDKIYAIAGTDGSNYDLDTVEYFSIRDNRWRYCQSVHYSMREHAGCVCNNKIFISGGSSGRDCLSRVSSYNPVDDSWTDEPSMMTARQTHCMVTVADQIYVIGGLDHDITFISTIEMFKPGYVIWTTCTANMSVCHPNAVAKDNIIYIVGGYWDKGRLSTSIFKFDTDIQSISIYANDNEIGGDNKCCLLKLPHAVYIEEENQ